MKKTLMSAVILTAALLIMGNGANLSKAETTPPGSETITPGEAAILNQQLESMKSILLQMKITYAESAPEPEPAPIAFSREELNVLSESLVDIKSQIAAMSRKAKANDMSAQEIALLQSSLSGLRNGLLAVKTSITETPASDIAGENKSSAIASFSKDAETAVLGETAKEPAKNNGNEKASAESSLGFNNFSKPAVIGTIIGIITLGIGLWIWRKKADAEEIPKTQL
ncbi:MAG: hypothetical protein NTW60_03670 [Candidatus Wolfebacteria bacterium]|nr:hypothetical protein [Candidatus Wolfebacteria bacterium]